MAVDPASAQSASSGARSGDAAPGGFRLLRHFTVATLIAFGAVALTLVVLQRMEEVYFERAQAAQRRFFAEAQTELARRQEAAARAGLMAVHEAGHVNLARLMANMLWQSDFGPFVRAAQGVAVQHCRDLPAPAGATPAGDPRRACFAEAGRLIRALPGFSAVDARAREAMRASTVFKVKVWDLRGIAVYSSEHRQVGEDGAANDGWRSAARGVVASELTHRERFSAFEQVVEDRDLISSYLPVREPGTDALVGVFEIYSDVTPLLEDVKASTRTFAELSGANNELVEQAARKSQNEVHASSNRFLVIVGALLALLYAVSLVIVQRGQRIIDRQRLAQEQAALREQLWHREKMAALAALAANVSHEIGNPLAIIAGAAQALPDDAVSWPGGRAGGGAAGDPGATASMRRLILEQTARVGAMVRRISDFAGARSASPDWVDVNALLKALCDFFAFDRRFRATPIEFEPGSALPACELVPDQLNEVMMQLLQACIDGAPERPRCSGVRVETAAHGDGVQIRIACRPAADGPAVAADAPLARAAVDAARRRVAEMGGQLVADGAAVSITLPATRQARA